MSLTLNNPSFVEYWMHVIRKSWNYWNYISYSADKIEYKLVSVYARQISVIFHFLAGMKYMITKIYPLLFYTTISFLLPIILKIFKLLFFINNFVDFYLKMYIEYLLTLYVIIVVLQNIKREEKLNPQLFYYYVLIENIFTFRLYYYNKIYISVWT